VILDELDILKDKSKVRETLGYLPQEFGVYPKVSSYNMLNHIVALKGISNKGLRKDLVESLLTKTNLWEVRNKRIVRYFALFN
jgi:ABC-2 type transport system ATP-binding protein